MWSPLARNIATVAVVHPYWSFWEHTVPDGFRVSRETLLDELCGRLSDESMRLRALPLLDSEEQARRLAGVLAADRPDAVLVVQTMAAPPTYVLELLASLSEVPVVIAALHERSALPDEFDHSDITTQGATVGTPMLTSVMARRGLPYDLTVGPIEDPETLADLGDRVRAAAVAGRLRRARLGRVGDPLPGYVHVDTDPQALTTATGIAVVSVPAMDFLTRFREASEEDVEVVRRELQAWDVEAGLEGEQLDRSLRACVAMDSLVAHYRLDGGAFNCHVDEIRFGDDIGITPCYALGRSTTNSVPWTCTGDVLTAVAMLVGKVVGGTAVYHELESIDYRTGEFIIANSGEHDLGWLAAGTRPRLVRNRWFCDVDKRCGVCAAFEPDPGPATLVAFADAPAAPGGYRLIAAAGELTSRGFPQTGTVNGGFRFAGGSVRTAWGRWVEAGVNHHSAAVPGSHAGTLERVARHLGIGFAAV